MDRSEYSIEYFEENGFVKKNCKKCGAGFWTRDQSREICSDAPCETYSFIGNPIFKEKNADEIRESFLAFFESHKHKRLKRYPVVARWRDDLYLNIASISNFQPFVTSGKVPPPANPLVISQPCIRLEDLESIGKTGRHLTTFEMMGHHAFNKRGVEEIYWKNETVRYCNEYLKQLGLDMERVTYKEAPWMGGGNAGPCLEVVTGGLELATLVFMDLELTHDAGERNIEGQWYRKMDTYIVDTGYGLERLVWASKGTPTVYDAVFPEMINELLTLAGREHPLVNYREQIMEFARLSGVMKKKEIMKQLNMTSDFFEAVLKPMEAIYAAADHTRCLAFMLADGIVPSNAKEGYLARLVVRRTFRLLKSLKIDTPLEELVILHIKLLRHSFPELEAHVDRISDILSLEKARYDETLTKGERIVRQKAKEYKAAGKLPLDTLIKLYDTHGIPPEFAVEIASESGSGMDVDIPEDFYSQVAKMHAEEKKGEIDPFVAQQKERTKSVPKTLKLYYDRPTGTEFEATVLDTFDDLIVLDKTLFYPEGGGQPADTGVLTVLSGTKSTDLKVVDVTGVDGVILHKVTGMANRIDKGALVRGRIDYQRRIAHARHHSATHIVIWAARKVLGGHIWQAGAQKGEERSRLDITHFKRISDEERREIELLANKMVMRDEVIDVHVEDKNEAEKKYGFGIYQGGVPASKELRIVRIGVDGDVQACAGTHCTKTGEVGPIKLLRTERIQDGIERLWYSAGEAAVRVAQAQDELINKSAAVLRIPQEKLPVTVERFFDEWKQLRKENESLRDEIVGLRLDWLKGRARLISGINIIAEVLPDTDMKGLLKMASQLSNEEFTTILMSKKGNHVSVVSSVPVSLKDRINASTVVKQVCAVLGGSGGGTPEIAQGGGEEVANMEEAILAGLRVVEEESL
ncbi:MAG: alanine--tRNA ligase [Halobacteriota archaeon]